MKRLVVMLALVVGSSCTFGVQTCERQADCEQGICTDGICLLPTSDAGGGGSGGGDGGTSGGGAGGGGGSPDAGGGAGGGGGGSDPCALVDCGPGYLCESGACMLKVTGVRILAPDGGTFGPTAPLVLSAELVTSASVPLPASLRVSAPAFAGLTTLQGQAGIFSAQPVTPTGSSGPATLTVFADFADAGFSASVEVTVDRQAPVVSMAFVPAPARLTTADFSEVDPSAPTAFKRDEVAELQVGSSEAIQVASADFTGLTPASAITPTACSVGCGQALCSCFAVDLAGLEMNGFRQTFSVALSARADAYGNVASTGSSADLPVTRWRWSRSVKVGSANAPIAVHSPAVAPGGTVYVGVEQDSSSGAVLAVRPDGSLLPGFDAGAPYGAVTASPVIGARLYVSVKSATEGAIRSHSLGSGEDGDGAVCGASARLFNSAMALADLGNSSERVVAVSRNGVLVAARPAAAVSRCVESAVPSLSGSNRYSLVADNAETYLANTSSATLSRVPWNALTPVPLTWGTRVETTAHNLFSDGLVRVGTVVGGGGGLTTGGVYGVPVADFSTSAPARFTLDGGSSAATAPAVAGSASAPEFVYGNGSRVVAVPLNGTTPPSFGVGNSVDLAGSDLVGTPAVGSDGTIYVVSDTGVVTALTSVLAPRWSVSLGGAVGSSVALDTARGAAGARVCSRPGTLYVGTTDTGRLHALIVDSRGLSGTAPWPTYQHDGARTGNPTRSLQDWSCP